MVMSTCVTGGHERSNTGQSLIICAVDLQDFNTRDQCLVRRNGGEMSDNFRTAGL